MNKIIFTMIFFFGMLAGGQAQQPTTGNTAFDAELDRLLGYTIPLISAGDLHAKLDQVQVFDARELDEYVVSHLPGAIHVGFKEFEKSAFSKLKKDEPIILYCSVGYRSEKIGEKLQKMGFTQVFNLYGSIFEWVNKGYPVENFTNKNVKEVHTFNEKWSQWITNPEIKKVW